MKETILARGAEATIIKKSNYLIKRRIRKGYRIQELDEKLRKQRTRQEARLLEKAYKISKVPKIISSNETTKEISLEYIKGKSLASCLDKKKNKNNIIKQLGKEVSKLHDANIIHGDLTTSNILLKGSNIYIIDFGLGYNSQREEDKAVDIHVFKEALQAKHPKHNEKLYQSFIKGYRTSKNAQKVLKQLEKVERRGRYKTQY